MNKNNFTQFVIDHMNIPAVWIKASGDFIYVNDAACRLLGYSRDELLSLSVPDIGPDFPRDKWSEHWVRVKQQRVCIIETEYKKKDGRTFPIEITINHLEYENDEYHCTFLRDISERRQTEESLKFIQYALDNFSDPAFWVNKDARFCYVNDAACRSLGYSREELSSMTIADIDPVFPVDSWDEYWKSTRHKNVATFETVHKRKDGTVFPVEIRSNHIKYNGEEFRCTFACDISNRKEVERALRTSEDRFKVLYDNNPSMLFTIAPNMEIVSVNKYGANELGYDVEELVGTSVLDLYHKNDRPSAKDNLQRSFKRTDMIDNWTLRKMRKDESILWVREITRSVKDETGQQSVLMVCEDVTEARQLSEKLSYQASHDALTGLINRNEFEARLHRVLDTAKQDGSEHALCYLDLDKFKIINDTCGHTAGDKLLQQLGNQLQKHVRKRDTLARLGGDEFAILMEHCNLEQAENVAKIILKEVQDYRLVLEEGIFNVGVSIGIVSITSSCGDMISVLQEADAACYKAKGHGRNRIHISKRNLIS